MHPARWRLAIDVDPKSRPHGIGTALLDQLAGPIPDQDKPPLQAAVSADNTAGRLFLHWSGFGLLMRTRRGTVSPRAANAAVEAETDDATDRLISAGFRVATLSDGGTDTGLRDAFADLHAEIYRLGHDWNPTSPITRDVARRLFMEKDEIIPETFAFGLLGDQPVAVASLRLGEAADTLDLGWVGVAARYWHVREEFLVALVGRCLASAAGRYETLTVEVDEADAQLWNLMGTLLIRWQADWLTLVRPYHNTSGLTAYVTSKANGPGSAAGSTRRR